MSDRTIEISEDLLFAIKEDLFLSANHIHTGEYYELLDPDGYAEILMSNRQKLIEEMSNNPS